MKQIEEILVYNEGFVKNKKYIQFQQDKFPNKKLVILSCMDTRLVELLPKAMNVANGDAKIIKSAGALVSHPFGSVMRSVLIAIHELGAEEVCVVGHHDCGMMNIDGEAILKRMMSRGIKEESLATLQAAGIDLIKFLEGFDDVEDSVRHSVMTIRNHPLIPKDIPVHGLLIHPVTGKLDLVIDGYKNEKNDGEFNRLRIDGIPE